MSAYLTAEPPPESRALKASSNGTEADSSEWDWPRAMGLTAALGLTTVHPPIERMAEQAALMTLHRLQQPFDEGWLDIVLKPQLIVRSSTRAV